MKHKFELSEAEICEAIGQYVGVKTGVAGKAEVRLTTSKHTDALDRWSGAYTVTATVTVEPSP